MHRRSDNLVFSIVDWRFRILSEEHVCESSGPSHVFRDGRVTECQVIEAHVAFTHMVPFSITRVNYAEVFIVNVVYQSMQMNAETAKSNDFYELDLVEMELHQVRTQLRQQLVSVETRLPQRHLRVSEETTLWND